MEWIRQGFLFLSCTKEYRTATSFVYFTASYSQDQTTLCLIFETYSQKLILKVKFGFCIVLEDQGPKGNLYTIWIEGEPMSEFRKFAINPHYRQEPKFSHLMHQLMMMLDRWGFSENFFRQEGTASDSVAALSRESGKLRLYCCRWGGNLLILGGGSVKNVRTTQDDPVLDRHVKRMMYVDSCLRERIRDREIWFGNNGELLGNLDFLLGE